MYSAVKCVSTVWLDKRSESSKLSSLPAMSVWLHNCVGTNQGLFSAQVCSHEVNYTYISGAIQSVVCRHNFNATGGSNVCYCLSDYLLQAKFKGIESL